MLNGMAPAATNEVGPSLRNPPTFIMAQGDLVTWLFKQNVPDPKDKSKIVERFSLGASGNKAVKVARAVTARTSG